MRLWMPVLAIAAASGALAAILPSRAHRTEVHTCGETVAFLDDAQIEAMKAPALTDEETSGPMAAMMGSGRSEEGLTLMGCLPESHPLIAVNVENAQQAVAIEDEQSSLGAIYRFTSTGERMALVEKWIGRWSPVSVHNRPDSDGVIGRWVNRMWRLPDGSAVNAMYLEGRNSGSLCLVRGNITAMKSSLAVLNNWCADRLGWWRKT